MTSVEVKELITGPIGGALRGVPNAEVIRLFIDRRALSDHPSLQAQHRTPCRVPLALENKRRTQSLRLRNLAVVKCEMWPMIGFGVICKHKLFNAWLAP
jgi:hypothetical protein